MRMTDAASVQWEKISQHRKESPWFRRLLKGERGELDNYEFTLVKVDERYDAPRHNHNFDQVRILLEGDFDFGPQVQSAGMIGYFPAGTFYTQSARGRSVTLLLQIGAACRQGYLDYDQVRQAAAELAQEGEFRDGMYHCEDETGAAQVLDGYEAVFRRGAGYPADIPHPRYEAPVLMNAEAVDALPDANGGRTRFFGTFNEYGLTISQRLGEVDDAVTLKPADRQKALYFVQKGALVTEEHGRIQAGMAIELQPGEALSGRVAEALEVVQIDLPDFDRFQ